MSCVHPAALSGFELAYLPEKQAKPDLESGALVEVLTNSRQTPEGYHLHFPLRRHPSPAGRAAERHSLASAYSLQAHHKTPSHRAASYKDEPSNHGLVLSAVPPRPFILNACGQARDARARDLHAADARRLTLYVTDRASHDSDDPPYVTGFECRDDDCAPGQ